MKTLLFGGLAPFSWKKLGQRLWRNKSVFVLGAVFLSLLGHREALMFDPAAPEMTGAQLGAYIRITLQPVVFMMAILLMALNMVVAVMATDSFRSFALRIARNGMMVAIIFWAGVCATTYVYTLALGDTPLAIHRPAPVEAFSPPLPR